MASTLEREFGEHLRLLLTFHQDDDDEGQGQFKDPVSDICEDDAGNTHIVLASGQKLRIIVETT